MSLAFIHWQSAEMLWAAAGVALPVAAHLLSRRGSRRITLPTARFLAAAQAQRGRRLRLSQWLLLALRMILIALVALIFARPQWRSSAPRGAEANDQQVIIVLDASASMGAASGSGRAFDTAQSRAQQRLASLDLARDSAGVVIAGVTSESALPRLSSNLAALRSAIEDAQVTDGSADLAQAVLLAQRLPADGGDADRTRRIILITDAQQTQLADLHGLSQQWPGLHLTIDSIRADAEALNCAVSALSLSPSRPTAGLPFDVRADIVNHGSQPVTLDVRCEAQPAVAAPAPVLLTIEPGATAAASFPCQVDQAGVVRLRITIPDDALEADNAVSAAALVREESRIAIVSSAPGQLSAASFLGTALQPDDQSPYAVVMADPTSTGPASLPWEDLDAVILCEAGQLPLDWLTRVDEYVRAGGGLWWFIDSPGAAAATDVFASINSDAPGLPLLVRRLLAQPQRVQWASADPQYEALASFDGEPLGTLFAVRHATYAQTSAAAGATVLLRDAQGQPLVAVRHIGRGRALVFNGAIDRDSSELARQPVFPALVHEWTAWLSSSEQPLPIIHPSTDVVLPLPGELTLDADLRLEPRLSFTRTGSSLRISRIDRAGDVAVYDAGSGAWLAGASVTIDPRESDLHGADAATLAAIERPDAAASEPGEAPTSGQAVMARSEVIEIWPWLMLAACAGAIAESAIALIAARRESGA